VNLIRLRLLLLTLHLKPGEILPRSPLPWQARSFIHRHSREERLPSLVWRDQAPDFSEERPR
jgi:hypothetical protein